MSEINLLKTDNIRVLATVTEGITGISANDTAYTWLTSTPEQLRFSSSMGGTFKPKLPYNIHVRYCFCFSIVPRVNIGIKHCICYCVNVGT